jgi:protein SCO1
VLVFIIPVLAYAAMNWYERRFQELPVMGPVTTTNGATWYHTIADFSLANQDGQYISTADWKGKIIVADFFFTHCPTICPAMTKNLARVQEVFKSDSEILINSFTVDPERDSVAQLKSYSIRFKLNNDNWHLLTGDKKDIYRLARNSFMIVATDGDGGPEDFIHSEKLVLVDKQRRIRGYYEGTNDKEIDQLIIDIKKLKNEN